MPFHEVATMPISVLARGRTWSSTFAESRAIRHTPRTYCCAVARRGIEPRLAESKSAVRSSTLAGHEYPDLDLNQGLNLRRVRCYPLHHRDMFSVPRPGLEPGPGPSQGPMLSTTPPGSVVSIPPWSRTRTKALGEPRAIRYTSGTRVKDEVTRTKNENRHYTNC